MMHIVRIMLVADDVKKRCRHRVFAAVQNDKFLLLPAVYVVLLYLTSCGCTVEALRHGAFSEN